YYAHRLPHPLPMLLCTHPAPTHPHPLSLHDALPIFSALEGAPLARVDQPELSGVPDTVVAAASAMVASAQTPLARIQAIVSSLQDGYFSHGLEGDAPSLARHGAARLAAMVGQEAVLGDAEQYA